MQARYEALTRTRIETTLRDRLANEDTLAAGPANRIAIFPIQYQGQDERYAPLGRGLSALITYDLGHVQRLEVLERLRMDVLVNELQLARSGLVVGETAPRLGRLLGAGRIIGGAYVVDENGTMRVDLAVQDGDQPAPTLLPATTLDLDAFYALQKDIVFRLLDAMQVPITEAERDQIEVIPTRNLQAFLAFCRGVEQEAGGQFGAAAALFDEAVALDPEFEPAAERAEVTQVQSGSSGGVGGAMAAASGAMSGLIVDDRAELVDARQQNLGANIGSLILPGPDARAPAAEAATARGGADGPPLPPTAQGN
jgi:TolB-like protein